jgi:hypothetical protein
MNIESEIFIQPLYNRMQIAKEVPILANANGPDL